jgi:hypothetical protein
MKRTRLVRRMVRGRDQIFAGEGMEHSDIDMVRDRAERGGPDAIVFGCRYKRFRAPLPISTFVSTFLSEADLDQAGVFPSFIITCIYS